MRKIPSAILILTLTALVSSCGSRALKPNPEQVEPLKAKYHNPHPEGTYAWFTAEPSYPKTSKAFRNSELMGKTSPGNSSLRINLATQRAQLLNDSKTVVIDYPVSSGKKGFDTPPGTYRVTEKLQAKRSNIYGKIYDAKGNLVKGDADARVDKVPKGGKYVGASMPYWMRLTGTGIGHHVGRVPRYRASHGCIRGPSSVLPQVYSRVRVGTKVEVTN